MTGNEEPRDKKKVRKKAYFVDFTGNLNGSFYTRSKIMERRC